MIKKEIQNLIEESIKKLQREGIFPMFKIPCFYIEEPGVEKYGDYSSNAALVLSKVADRSSREIAEKIEKNLDKKNEIIKKTEVAGAGFINFFISKKYLQDQIPEIIKQKKKFGALEIGAKQKVNIEFISANPTGPLTLGNGRGGFCGDVLANVLDKAGYKTTREYYINDRGAQITKLGHSVLGDSEAVYKGEYINNLRKELLGNPMSQLGHRVSQPTAEEVGQMAVKIILNEMIKPSVKKMVIHFDVWFSEKTLYDKGLVDKAIKDLSKNGHTYESEGAVWFKCKNLGDDKDRVLVRKDGIKTYIASDIAYLENKISRGFKKIILFLGADHYGYLARLGAAARVLGFDKQNLSAIVMQLVRLFKDGREVRMSKRTGTYVTIDELIDEVGLDAARFFFLTRSSDTHLNFDMDLAKKQSAENPVYYIQYAYARICSILRKCKMKNANLKMKMQNVKLLNDESELALLKQLIRLPEIIEEIAKDYQVQRLPQYALDLADAVHKFYENCRVISEDKKLTQARLALVLAAKITLKNTLRLMGVSSPEKM